MIAEMKILAILVLYNCKISESKTIASLLKGCSYNPEAYDFIKLIIYDNGLDDQKASLTVQFNNKYVHHPENAGVAVAYNFALTEAIAQQYDWILLLDQDSNLPRDFIPNLVTTLSNIEQQSDVVAIVPKICYEDKLISPSRVLYGGIHRPIDYYHRGICNFQVTTIGSGTLLRTSFLQKIGGFNELYWLDWLDMWILNVIHASGSKVYVTDSIIEHELSILNYDKFMNENRYRNILKYEAIFMRSHKSKCENYIYFLRLARRSLVLLFTARNKKYSILTLYHLIDLVFHAKPWSKKQ